MGEDSDPNEGGSQGDGSRITRRNPPLPRTETRVVLTTGSHHMQTYWVASNSGREVRNLPFLYLIDDQRWVPREDAFIRPPDSGRMMGDWNSVCLRCHTTGPNPKYDFVTNTLDTEVVEFGIACEACHGPAAAHVTANRDPARRQRLELGIEPDPTILHPRRVSPKASTQVCGQCHGIYSVYDATDFAVHGFRYRPGDEIEDTRYYLRHPSNETQPARPQAFTPTVDYLEHYYWPDGMVRSTGREYQGLTESPCYLRGNISCVSCHTMHEGDRDDQLNPELRGNQACLQCHASFAADLTGHTHHPPKSPGSNCYNCHIRVP